MTDDEAFAVVMGELSILIRKLGVLGAGTVLIGGQALAIESLRRGGSGVIQATTDTGVTVERGFTLESDLLIDVEADPFMADRLPEVLRDQGYARVRGFRWAKKLTADSSRQVELDLFCSPGADPQQVSTQMTELPDGDLVLQRSVLVDVELLGELTPIRIPDALAFLVMKLRAKHQHRPQETKDSFDIYSYVQLHGASAISAS